LVLAGLQSDRVQAWILASNNLEYCKDSDEVGQVPEVMFCEKSKNFLLTIDVIWI
jgi:hypothetical protein